MDLSDGAVPDGAEESNLLFVSMSAFNILRSNHEGTVSGILHVHLFLSFMWEASLLFKFELTKNIYFSLHARIHDMYSYTCFTGLSFLF